MTPSPRRPSNTESPSGTTWREQDHSIVVDDSDGLHPNAAGYEPIYNAFMQVAGSQISESPAQSTAQDSRLALDLPK